MIDAPSLLRVLAALGAMAALGAAAALGSADLEIVARASAMLLAPTLGAIGLTGPALLAVHQLLGLAAPPEQLVAALAHAVDRGGAIALGLVPIAIVFALTSGLWPLVLAATVALPAVAMTVIALCSLRAVETGALVCAPRFALLLLGWGVLSVAIGLRIAVSMAGLVAEGMLS